MSKCVLFNVDQGLVIQIYLDVPTESYVFTCNLTIWLISYPGVLAFRASNQVPTKSLENLGTIFLEIFRKNNYIFFPKYFNKISKTFLWVLYIQVFDRKNWHILFTEVLVKRTEMRTLTSTSISFPLWIPLKLCKSFKMQHTRIPPALFWK